LIRNAPLATPSGPPPRIFFLFILLFSLCASSIASAQSLSVSETEALVRASYFEGMPEEDAARIGPAGAERLIAMLGDPDEASSQAQILLALGLCGSRDARGAILDWAATLRGESASARANVTRRDAKRETREIDRDTFKAWQALPHALGALAKFDSRAIDDLETMLTADAPDWRFRRFEGPRLRDLARRGAATSLALTGLPQARRALDAAGADASDARFETRLREARIRHGEVVRERSR
jgi:hypothetical protein